MEVAELLKEERVRKTALLLALSLLLWLFPKNIPYLDQKGQEYFKSAFKEALSVYAVARITNAVVSLAKDTQVEITPLGVGVNFQVGALLDPIDDATERLSTILTVSLITLGLMGLSFLIGQAYAFKVISLLLLLTLPAVWFKRAGPLKRWAVLTSLILLSFRIALPVCGLLNEAIYKNFFKPQIESSLVKFSKVEGYFKELSELQLLEVSLQENFNQESKSNEAFSFFSKVKELQSEVNNFIDSAKTLLKEKAQTVKELTLYLRKFKGELIQTLVNLIVAVSTMIIFQAIILPLFVAWSVYKLIELLLNGNS
ncbi:hypothetical protein [Thermovibrio sp.]